LCGHRTFSPLGLARQETSVATCPTHSITIITQYICFLIRSINSISSRDRELLRFHSHRLECMIYTSTFATFELDHTGVRGHNGDKMAIGVWEDIVIATAKVYGADPTQNAPRPISVSDCETHTSLFDTTHQSNGVDGLGGRSKYCLIILPNVSFCSRSLRIPVGL
jgi:hypothetical protein